MQNVTLEIMLNYLWNFAIIWVLCFLGCLCRDVSDTIKNCSKVELNRVIFPTVMLAVILCSILSYVTLPFPLIVVIAVLGGSYSSDLVNHLYKAKNIAILAKNICKNISNPITKGVAESIKEIKEENDKKQKEAAQLTDNSEASENNNDTNKSPDG